MTKRTWCSQFNLDSSSDDEDEHFGYLSSSSEDSDYPRYRRDERTGDLVQILQDEETGEWYTVEEWKTRKALQQSTAVAAPEPEVESEESLKEGEGEANPSGLQSQTPVCAGEEDVSAGGDEDSSDFPPGR